MPEIKTRLLYRASPRHKPTGSWEVESELGHPVCVVDDEATAMLFANALNTRPGGYYEPLAAAASPDVAGMVEEAKRLAFKYAERFHDFQILATQERESDQRTFRNALDAAIDALGAAATQVRAAAPALAREPLSKEEIRSCEWALSAGREYEKWTGQEILVVEGIEEFARAIERAHGITADSARAATSEPPEDDPYFGVQDEVYLSRAVSVMNDVLTDIEGWEDKALADAVKSSKVDLCAMIECIRMRADSNYVPGTKPIDGEFPSEPPEAAGVGSKTLRELDEDAADDSYEIDGMGD